MIIASDMGFVMSFGLHWHRKDLPCGQFSRNDVLFFCSNMLRDMVSVVSRAHEVNSVGVCKNIMGKCPGSATVSMIRESYGIYCYGDSSSKHKYISCADWQCWIDLYNLLFLVAIFLYKMYQCLQCPVSDTC